MGRLDKGKKVVDFELSETSTLDTLIRQMHGSGGFTAKKVAVGVDILETMFKTEDCVNFLAFPANIISTGTRGIIKALVKNKYVDIIITTCGTLDHDLARIWRDYYHGEFEMDDVELRNENIHRLGNILVPAESYGIILEQKMQPILEDIYQAKLSEANSCEFSTKELIWEFGKTLEDESSIIYWCTKNQIPIYVPGITDGAFGSQLWMFTQKHKDFKLNLFKDEQELSDVVFTAKKTGALIVGGGISKHHVLWWNQYREGLDYSVYITTAQEHDGSLSGARLREAISWGKLQAQAQEVTIDGDATVILPIMVGAVIERLKA
ncbi:MAG: deoxyhypusine synthase [Thermoplasmata archaeon]|nr:deoxyhypusine synthase [Thermoplasmata archaeon]